MAIAAVEMGVALSAHGDVRSAAQRAVHRDPGIVSRHAPPFSSPKVIDGLPKKHRGGPEPERLVIADPQAALDKLLKKTGRL